MKNLIQIANVADPVLSKSNFCSNPKKYAPCSIFLQNLLYCVFIVNNIKPLKNPKNAIQANFRRFRGIKK